MNDFAVLLEKLRETRQISKKQLALSAGLSAGYVSLLTLGERDAPSEETVADLANALELDEKERIQLFEAAGYPASSVFSYSPPMSHHRGQLRTPRKDWGEIPNVEAFCGRKKDLELLEHWVLVDRCQLVTVWGIGGVGKTMLAAKSAVNIQQRFDYFFWRSLQDNPSIESILKDCIQLFSDQQRNIPEDLQSKDVEKYIGILIEYLRESRCLMVLDNLESILKSGSPVGDYQQEYEGYGKLLQRVGEIQHQSCLLLTSREKPKEIPRLEGKNRPVRSMHLSGVEQSEAQEILKDEHLIGSDETWAKFVEQYAGNPLVLKLVSEPIRELFDRDIAAFLIEKEADVSDIYELLDQQFNRLSKLEQDIIYWLAIGREAVSLDEMHEDIVPRVSRGDLRTALTALRRRSMIETSGAASFFLQPVIMEYATNRFIERMYKEIATGSSELLMSHAMIKAQAKDYVRDRQVRLILAPIAEHLLNELGKIGSEQQLRSILSNLRQTYPQVPGYGAGNILNVLVQLKTDLCGYDFSHLVVWQAYLQGVLLREVNFAYANLSRSIFTDSFSSIFAVTLSPDGELLAAGTANGEVRLWDTTRGTPIHTLWGHTEWVRSVAFSPDGTMLASCSEDETVRLWDVRTGECLKILEGHQSRIYSVACSPDGTTVASGSDDQTIRLWDVRTGECLKILEGHQSRIYSVACSPDGTTVASGSDDQTIRLWDVRTGECLKILWGHTNRVRSVAFHPYGTILASASEDATVRLWDVHTGRCFKTIQGHTNRIWSVAFSPDGSTVASGSDDQTIRLWDGNTGEHLKTLHRHGSRVYSVAFSCKDNIIASGSDNQTIRLWDAITGECLKTLQGHGNRAYSVTFHPTGNILASGSEDQTIRFWDIHNGKCLKTLPGHTHWVWSVVFSPDGTMLASGSEDWTVKLWDTCTDTSPRTLEGHGYRVYSVTFNPTGNIVASSSGDQTVKLWEVSTGTCLKTLQEHTNRVRSVTFHPSGNSLASGSDDQTIKLWNILTGICYRTLQGHTNRIGSVAFSPDGTMLASGSDDGTIKLWDVDTGTCLKTLQGHTNRVYSVAFSPDGNIIASGGEDQAVKLWDVQTGECIKTLQGHGCTIYAVAFSPNGRIVASSSHDGNIRLWDAQTGESIRTLRSHRPYEGMNITDVKGLTSSQKATLMALGATEGEP
jgi:WD40 repeat protein/transcriptional regulator with XRE-family HTH domain